MFQGISRLLLAFVVSLFMASTLCAQKTVDPKDVRGYSEEQPNLSRQLILRSLTGAAADEPTDTEALVDQMIEEAADDQAEEEAEDAAESRFLKWGFGAGVGVSIDLESGDRIDEASLDPNGIVRVSKESNEVPRILLETHYFFEGKQKYYIPESSECPPGDDPCDDKRLLATWGHGPFVGIQSSDDEILDSFALGWMIGFRRSGAENTSSNSFNLGIGLLIDRQVKSLGDGIEANQPLPTGETEIRFKEESRLGAVLVASFAF